MPHHTGPRLWQLDALRGLALVNMIAYHALYDWVYVFGLPCAWYDISAPGCHIWQQYICWSFLLIAGFQLHAFARAAQKRPAHARLRRGADRCHSGVPARPGHLVRRAALNRLRAGAHGAAAPRSGSASPRPPGWRCRRRRSRCSTSCRPAGSGFEGLRLVRLPAALYRLNWFWLGLPDLSRFSSADYFPLLPWLFLFWCGYFTARLCGREHLRAAAAPPPRRAARAVLRRAAHACCFTCCTSRLCTGHCGCMRRTICKLCANLDDAAKTRLTGPGAL